MINLTELEQRKQKFISFVPNLIELKIFATLFRVIFVLFKCRFTMVELLVNR